MSVPLATIAARAQASQKTVANVLNPKYRHLYSPATVARILAIADELGYQRNASARSLVSRSFGAIGLLLSTSSQASYLPQGLLSGIEEALNAAGLALTVAQIQDERLRDPARLPRLLTELMVDGLLVDYNSSVPDALHQQIARAARPAVWLNCDLPTEAVRLDDEGGARALAIALAAAGHRRVAWVDEAFHCSGSMRHYSKIHRRRGFAAGCREAGIACREFIDEPGAPPLLQRLRAALAESGRPTAVVAYGDEHRDAIDAAARAGLEIGRDLTVCTFASQGADTFGSFPIVPVVLPEDRCGAGAVERLLRMIAGSLEPGWTTELVPLAVPTPDRLRLPA